MSAIRLLAAAAVATAGVTLGMVPAASASAGAVGSADGVCPTADGVTVVVDFQELGGGVNVRCATGNLPTGFAALDAAGINYQTTVRFSGFLCRIAGLPTNDPCINASPATAYWSYWLAPRGGQWCYSNWGAGNRTPPPGSVEGWSFSLNKNASTSPPPRLAVPAAVPGSPASLPANDCDQSASAPRPPTANAPATNPPAASPPATGPVVTTPPATNGPGTKSAPTTASPASRPAATPGAPATTVPGAVQAQTTIAGATTVPGEATVPGETAVAGETTVPADTTTVPGTSDGTSDGTSTTVSLDDAELAGSIDLGSGSDEGSPVGVIVTMTLLVLLGGAAVAFRRRNRG